MERSRPMRNPHPSTSDLLTWTEVPPSSSAAPAVPFRSHQPSDGISKVLHGDHVTNEEAHSLNKMKPCSEYKLKDITGSGIFAANSAPQSDGSNSTNKTRFRMYQQVVNGISQISFTAEESIIPKKPTSLPEKQVSNFKNEELTGNGIFVPPTPEVVPQAVAAAQNLESRASRDMEEPAPRNVCTSIKVSNPAGGQNNIMFSEAPVENTSNKTHNQKFAELTDNDIYKGDVHPSGEKAISTSKMREMSGSDIFADGKVESRGYRGSVHKPPGDESSIALVSTSKMREMSGSDIFSDGKVESRGYRGGVHKPPGGESINAPVSTSKMREMSGSDIFANGKVESRGYRGGVHKPLGDERSIALVSTSKMREMSGSDIFADGKVESRGYRGSVHKPPSG